MIERPVPLRDFIRVFVPPFIALVSVVVYAYLAGPGRTAVSEAIGLGSLPGDFPEYANRFAASFLFLGVVPVATAFACGYRPRNLGLRWNPAFLRDRVFWICLAVLTAGSVAGALDPDIAAFYPYGKTIAGYAAQNAWWYLLHAALYAVLYYLPWEICFRSVMVWPLLGTPGNLAETDGEKPGGGLPAGERGGVAGSLPRGRVYSAASAAESTVAIAASFASISASTLLHLPHPFAETVTAAGFGVLAFFLALRYRSIVPGFILHLAAGLALDAVLIAGR